MPCDYTKYPPDWKRISRAVRDDADNKCERCAAPNGMLIARGVGVDAGTYMLEGGETCSDQTGEFLGYRRGSEYNFAKLIKVVLTVAHLNHDTTDNRRVNLRAWCQKCHLAHDKDLHVENARKTRHARKADRELFDPNGEALES